MKSKKPGVTTKAKRVKRLFSLMCDKCIGCGKPVYCEQTHTDVNTEFRTYYVHYKCAARAQDKLDLEFEKNADKESSDKELSDKEPSDESIDEEFNMRIYGSTGGAGHGHGGPGL